MTKLAGTTPVTLFLNPSTASDDQVFGPTGRLYLEEYANGLLADLDLGGKVEVSVADDGGRTATGSWQLRVGGRLCRSRWPSDRAVEERAPEALWTSAARALFENRELFLTPATAGHVLTEVGSDDLRPLDMLEDLLRRCFGVRHLAHGPATPMEARVAMLYPLKETPHAPLLENACEAARGRLFEALGVIVPPIEIAESPNVPSGHVQVRVNDVRLPPGPATAAEHDLDAALLANAAALLTTDTASFACNRLSTSCPRLVEAAAAVLDAPRLAAVLRDLLEDGVPVGDLKSVLDGLLAVLGTTTADSADRILFQPAAGTLYPSKQRSPVQGLSSSEIADCIRLSLSRQLTHRYASSEKRLSVYLLSPAIETSVLDGDYATEEQQQLLVSAIAATAGPLALAAFTPVVLTVMTVRRALHRLIARELPDLHVVAYEELSPDTNIEPLDRIEIP